MSSRTFFAELVRVIDGDTVELRIDLGFYNTHTDHFRLAGIDTPEHSAGIPAKQKLQELLATLTKLTVIVDKADKYGRWLVTIPIDEPIANQRYEGLTVNQRLIDLGFAKPYDGGKK